jgi:hypothetical protein
MFDFSKTMTSKKLIFVHQKNRSEQGQKIEVEKSNIHNLFFSCPGTTQIMPLSCVLPLTLCTLAHNAPQWSTAATKGVLSSLFGTMKTKKVKKVMRMRAQVQQRLVLQDKEQREEELRQLANQARMERSGVSVVAAAASKLAVDNGNNQGDAVSDDDEASPARETDDDVAARQRERLRLERKKERERELRLESNQELKKQKFEQERDISEKIALGVHTGHGGGLSGEVDARLYNQMAGMDLGFGADDVNNA